MFWSPYECWWNGWQPSARRYARAHPVDVLFRTSESLLCVHARAPFTSLLGETAVWTTSIRRIQLRAELLSTGVALRGRRVGSVYVRVCNGASCRLVGGSASVMCRDLQVCLQSSAQVELWNLFLVSVDLFSKRVRFTLRGIVNLIRHVLYPADFMKIKRKPSDY